jgi:hypothetical protein
MLAVAPQGCGRRDLGATTMRYLLAAMLACAVAQFAPALAAGPYDGTWSGAVAGSGAQCPANVFTMQIQDNAVRGTVLGRVPFKGTVTADGSVTGAYDYPKFSLSGTIAGKIAGDQFTGQLESKFHERFSCTRNLSAKRS